MLGLDIGRNRELIALVLPYSAKSSNPRHSKLIRYYLTRKTDAGSVPYSTESGQSCNLLLIDANKRTFSQTTEGNRTTLCSAP